MNITLNNISKKYLLKEALKDISVTFSEKKIHALLGENGAGKSTLASILSGSIQPSSGEIIIDGKKAVFSSPKDAIEKGIVIVQQRPLLASALTALENILLNSGLNSGQTHTLMLLDKVPKKLETLHSKYAPDLPLNALVKDLGGNYRFYVSLLSAMLKNPSLLILDEPSAFLDMNERKKLYENLKQEAEKGCNIIVITHSTAEAELYADSITILQKGQLKSFFASVQEYKRANSYIINSVKNDKKERITNNYDNPKESSLCFELCNVSYKPKNRPALLNTNIKVFYSQITAITGMKEAAMETLEDVATGMAISRARGYVVFNLKHSENAESFVKINLSKRPLTTRFLRKNNTAIVSSDRIFRASNPNLNILQMLTSYIRKGNLEQIAKEMIKNADVNIDPYEKCKNLSGGMTQRLIFARELYNQPSLMILCNPMQGLDVQAQGLLAYKIANLAKKGCAILIIGAADFPLSLCSRVYELESGSTHLAFDISKER